MIVIADTSPVNYLVLIGEDELLHQLYERVLIPPAVLGELLDPASPPRVLEWIRRHPPWLEVRKATVHLEYTARGLDLGEREALDLADENRPHALLLMDEETGRKEARRRGLRTTGTLGILDDASRRGLVDLGDALQRLRKTNFRASYDLFERLMVRDSQRKKGATP